MLHSYVSVVLTYCKLYSMFFSHRCKCEFFYTTYGETGVDKIPSGIPDIPPAPRNVELWDEINKPVEAFTLMHHDLNVFTNSLQVQAIDSFKIS